MASPMRTFAVAVLAAGVLATLWLASSSVPRPSRRAPAPSNTAAVDGAPEIAPPSRSPVVADSMPGAAEVGDGLSAFPRVAVSVRDTRGRPVEGAIVVAWAADEDALEASHRELGRTDALGVAHCPLPEPLHAAWEAPGGIGVQATRPGVRSEVVRASEDRATIELTLDCTSTLSVRFPAILLHESTRLSVFEPANRRDTEVGFDVVGTARIADDGFAHVEVRHCGALVTLVLELSGYDNATLAGGTVTPAPEAVTSVELRAAARVVTMRLLEGDTPVTDARVRVGARTREGLVLEHELLPDAAGRILGAFPLDAGASDEHPFEEIVVLIEEESTPCARVTCHVPPMPAIHDFGDVFVAPAPILVQGRCVDDRGEAVPGVHVAIARVTTDGGVGETLRQGVADRCANDGTFTVHGFVEAGEVWLFAGAPDHVAIEPVRVLVGSAGLQFVLRRLGSLRASVRLAGCDDVEGHGVTAVLVDAEGVERSTALRRLERGAVHWSWPMLTPGVYGLSVSVPGGEVVHVQGLRVSPGAVNDERRERPIELDGMTALEIRLTSRTVPGRSRYVVWRRGASGPWQALRCDADGRARTAVRAGGRLFGWEPGGALTPVPLGGPGPTTVAIAEAWPVVVRVPDGVTRVRLVPDGAPIEVALPGRSVRRLWATWPSLDWQEVRSDAVTFDVPHAGSYLLEWLTDDGAGDGGRWEIDGPRTIDVSR